MGVCIPATILILVSRAAANYDYNGGGGGGLTSIAVGATVQITNSGSCDSQCWTQEVCGVSFSNARRNLNAKSISCVQVNGVVNQPGGNDANGVNGCWTLNDMCSDCLKHGTSCAANYVVLPDGVSVTGYTYGGGWSNACGSGQSVAWSTRGPQSNYDFGGGGSGRCQQ